MESENLPNIRIYWPVQNIYNPDLDSGPLMHSMRPDINGFQEVVWCASIGAPRNLLPSQTDYTSDTLIDTTDLRDFYDQPSDN